MAQVLVILQYLVAAAFLALGTLLAVEWLRRPDRRRGWIAAAVGTLAVVALLARLQVVFGLGAGVTDLLIALLLFSGYSLLELRATFIPLSPATRLGALALNLAAGLVAVLALPPLDLGPNWLHGLAAIGLLLVWAADVTEPTVRFWLASRGLPAVQRARLRTLSAGYTGLVLIALVPALAGVASDRRVEVVTQIVALLTVPLLFASFATPNWLRRIWREPEEEAFRRAIQELLLFSATRRELARKALDWALRLMGADAGVLSDGKGALLAIRGLPEEAAERILAQAGQSPAEGLIELDDPSRHVAIVADLPLGEGPGKLIISSGPFTPVFGSDEVVRLRQYTTAITAGLDRVILTERIAALERTKTEFLNLASHELRGPLTVLRGYLAMMQAGSMGSVNPQIRDILPVLALKADEMHSLVEQMIEAARLEEGRLKLHIEASDLRQIVQEAIQTSRPLVDPKHQLEVKAPRQAIPVAVDREKIGTILTNLLSNAIKYSPAGGEVVCSVAKEDGLAKVAVTDKGIGIAPEDQARLFTRFGRIENPETAHIGGTGLGLYLSRELARLHGGDLTVQSRPGSGSTFILAVPLAEAS